MRKHGIMLRGVSLQKETTTRSTNANIDMH